MRKPKEGMIGNNLISSLLGVPLELNVYRYDIIFLILKAFITSRNVSEDKLKIVNCFPIFISNLK